MSKWIVLAAACGLAGCGKRAQDEPRFAQPAVAPAAAPSVDKGAARPDAGSPQDPGNPHGVVVKPDAREGWVHEELDDQVPLCIFSDYEERGRADFIEKVRPQKLRAGSVVVFGAFAPRCLHRDCDDSPTLQAWLDEGGDGRTFVVHTKYTGEHRTYAECDACEVVIAGVQTPELAPGSYVVKYGALTQEFKVPSTLKQPCLGAKKSAAKKGVRSAPR